MFDADTQCKSNYCVTGAATFRHIRMWVGRWVMTENDQISYSDPTANIINCVLQKCHECMCVCVWVCVTGCGCVHILCWHRFSIYDKLYSQFNTHRASNRNVLNKFAIILRARHIVDEQWARALSTTEHDGILDVNATKKKEDKISQFRLTEAWSNATGQTNSRFGMDAYRMGVSTRSAIWCEAAGWSGRGKGEQRTWRRDFLFQSIRRRRKTKHKTTFHNWYHWNWTKTHVHIVLMQSHIACAEWDVIRMFFAVYFRFCPSQNEKNQTC